MSGPWQPPAPSLAALPVDRSKTEPKPAYYKLQFGDDVTGFSYYVRTLSVVIGRGVEKPASAVPQIGELAELPLGDIPPFLDAVAAAAAAVSGHVDGLDDDDPFAPPSFLPLGFLSTPPITSFSLSPDQAALEHLPTLGTVVTAGVDGAPQAAASSSSLSVSPGLAALAEDGDIDLEGDVRAVSVAADGMEPTSETIAADTSANEPIKDEADAIPVESVVNAIDSTASAADATILDIKPDLHSIPGIEHLENLDFDHDLSDLPALPTVPTDDGRSAPPPPPPTKSGAPVDHVDVDLGPLKSVSRNHAKIEYRTDMGQFCLEIFGRNGAWVDDRYYVKGTIVPLGQGSQIQIATRIFSFVLPPSPESSPTYASHALEATSTEGMYSYEGLPYPYNLPADQVGYAEFFGEPGPGPASAAHIAARMPAPFNAFAAADGYGLGIEGVHGYADHEWIDDEWDSGDGDSEDDSSDDDDEDDDEEDEEEEEDDVGQAAPRRTVIKIRARRIHDEESDLTDLSSDDEGEGEGEEPEQQSQVRGRKTAPKSKSHAKRQNEDGVASVKTEAATASTSAVSSVAGKGPAKLPKVAGKGFKSPALAMKKPEGGSKSKKKKATTGTAATTASAADDSMDIDEPDQPAKLEPVEDSAPPTLAAATATTTTPTKKKKSDKAKAEGGEGEKAEKPKSKKKKSTAASAAPATAVSGPATTAAPGPTVPIAKAGVVPPVPPTIAAAIATPAPGAAAAPPPVPTLAAAMAQTPLPTPKPAPTIVATPTPAPVPSSVALQARPPPPIAPPPGAPGAPVSGPVGPVGPSTLPVRPQSQSSPALQNGGGPGGPTGLVGPGGPAGVAPGVPPHPGMMQQQPMMPRPPMMQQQGVRPPMTLQQQHQLQLHQQQQQQQQGGMMPSPSPVPEGPPRPYFISELVENPDRPGHILCNVPIPPSGAGPRPPPQTMLGLDGKTFIGPPPLKPTATFATIIHRALVHLPRGRGTLGEVCNWVAGEWEWFRLNPEAGWQNSIRHNLSLNKAFLKVPRIPEDDPESKGSVWILDPEEGPLFEEKQRRDALKSEGKAKNAEEKRMKERQKAEERARKQRERDVQISEAAKLGGIPGAHPHHHALGHGVMGGGMGIGGMARPMPVRPIARPIPQAQAAPPQPTPPAIVSANKGALAPKAKIVVAIQPITPVMRAKSVIDKTDVSGAPLPFVCDGTTLVLEQQTFGHLTTDIIDKLQLLGAAGAVDVLSAWVVNKNKQQAQKAAAQAKTALPGTTKLGSALGMPVRPGSTALGAARPLVGMAGKPMLNTAKPGGLAGAPHASGPGAGGKPLGTAGAAPTKPLPGPAPPGANLTKVIGMIAEVANARGDVNTVGPNASALLRYIRVVGVDIDLRVAERIWATGIVPPLPPKKVGPNGAKPAPGGVAAKPGGTAGTAGTPGAVKLATPGGTAGTPAPGPAANVLKRKLEDGPAASTPGATTTAVASSPATGATKPTVPTPASTPTSAAAVAAAVTTSSAGPDAKKPRIETSAT